jgi:subtilase family serine protease
LVFGALGYVSGGGFSMNYGIPSYQNSVSHTYTSLRGSTITASGRMTPDVSFNAAVYGGVMTFEHDLDFPSGHWYVNGGTSAASPAWAAIMALANQANGGPLGFVNPAIYGIMGQNSQGKSPFHDITQGNNADCSGLCGEDGYLAGKGYDMTTGFGTPDVSHFISAIAPNSQRNQ